jgi:hypothetical protein
MKYTPAHAEAAPGEHIVLTGPIKGDVTLADGTVYAVTDPAIVVDPDHAAEVAHLIGLRYAAEGHPEHDDETPFAYEAPKAFAKYAAHPDNTTLEG